MSGVDGTADGHDKWPVLYAWSVHAASRDPAVRQQGLEQLRDFIHSELREVSGNSLARLMRVYASKVHALIQSSVLECQMQGLLAAELLIDMVTAANASTLVQLVANVLRSVLSGPQETLYAPAARALGRLATREGTLVRDCVEFELKRAIEWMSDKSESRRLCAVLMLRELAQSAPTYFFQSIEPYIRSMWPTLCDTKPEIYVHAAKALRAALHLVCLRGNAHRFYETIYTEASEGLKSSTSNVVHGSLLAVGELLRHQGDRSLMETRFKECCDAILKQRNSRDRRITRTVISLLPRLAVYDPQVFAETKLAVAVGHFMDLLRRTRPRHLLSVLASIGDVALAVGAPMVTHLPAIVGSVTNMIQASIKTKEDRSAVLSACHACIGKLSVAVGAPMEPYLLDQGVLELMFSTGLHPAIVDVTHAIMEPCPRVALLAQEWLLDMICLVLFQRPFHIYGVPSIAMKTTPAFAACVLAQMEANGRATTALALAALRHVRFATVLVPLAGDLVTLFDGADPLLQQEALRTCAFLLGTEQGMADRRTVAKDIATTAAAVVQHMVSVAVTDVHVDTRRLVLQLFAEETRFDDFLAQCENLQPLFLLAYDSVLDVRAQAIRIIGRLGKRNPALVTPHSRKLLAELLDGLQFATQKELWALCISALLTSASPSLVRPHVDNITDSLLPYLAANSLTTNGEHPVRLVAAVMGALSSLARVGKDLFVHRERNLWPVIIPMLSDASLSKRLAAYRLLLSVANAGAVIQPYLDHGELLSILVTALKQEESPVVRAEVLRCLGSLGALDPERYKRQQQRNDVAPIPIETDGTTSYLGPNMSPAQYPRTAIGALADLLNETTLPMLITSAVEALMTIFGSMHVRDVVPYLSTVVPLLVRVLAQSVESIRQFLMQQLASLVSQARQYIRPYLGDIMDLVGVHWATRVHDDVLSLVEELAGALGDEFAPYLPRLVPLLVSSLRTHQGNGGSETAGSGLAPVSGVTVANADGSASVLQAMGGLGDDVVGSDSSLMSNVSDAMGHLHHHPGSRSVLALLEASGVSNGATGVGYDGAGAVSSGVSDAPMSVSGGGVASEARGTGRRAGALTPPPMDVGGATASGSMSSISSLLSSEAQGHRAQVSWDRQLRVLLAVQRLATLLQAHTHIMVPPICTLLSAPPKVAGATVRCLCRIARSVNLGPHLSNIVSSTLPLLSQCQHDSSVVADVMQCIRTLIVQYPRTMIIFMSSIRSHMRVAHVADADFDALEQRLCSGTHLDLVELSTMEPDVGKLDAQEWRQRHRGRDGRRVSESIAVNHRNLARAWDTTRCETARDWVEWLNRFRQTLLVESASPAFRACLSVAQIYTPLARKLFNVAFASCWKQLDSGDRRDLCSNLMRALGSAQILPEILQCILDLAEFMDVDDVNLRLAIPPSVLGTLAFQSQAYAKALRYKEEEFMVSPERNVDQLLAVYTQLQMPDAAIGLMTYVEEKYSVRMAEAWYEKLHRWDEALAIYQRQQEEEPLALEPAVGRLRCLQALSEWSDVAAVCDQVWRAHGVSEARGEGATMGTATPMFRRDLAPIAANAAYHLSDWEALERYVAHMRPGASKTLFFDAVVATHKAQWNRATDLIAATRRRLDADITALVGESYGRAYSRVVKLQQLAELEEVIAFRRDWIDLPANEVAAEKAHLLHKWEKRLKGCSREVDVMQSMLAVRTVGFSPIDHAKGWLKLASLCRKKGRLRLCDHVLRRLLGGDNPLDNPRVTLESSHTNVVFAAIRLGWASGRKVEAMEQVQALVHRLMVKFRGRNKLLSRAYYALTTWKRDMLRAQDGTYFANQDDADAMMQCCKMAVRYDEQSYKVWHMWATVNFEAINHYEASAGLDRVRPFLAPVVRAFFHAIQLCTDGRSFRDTLRLLTIWFKYGAQPDVEEMLMEGFDLVPLETWLQVMPQIIARVHTPQPVIRRLVHDLLCQVGMVHPQALVFPLVVASKAHDADRQEAAGAIMDKLRQHSPELVEQALVVDHELIATAMVLHERWYEGLEEAAAHFYTHNNVEAMLARLAPMHEELRMCDFATRHQRGFQEDFGHDLAEAWDSCQTYHVTGDVTDINVAWESYARVYHKLRKKIPKLKKLKLPHVSPVLADIRGMSLAVPGTYAPGRSWARIHCFLPDLKVYSTKQRPRHLTIVGDDGKEYMFVLKGHEDLRQDERVIQFFALVNTLLAASEVTAQEHMDIEIYPVIPLSPTAGLIGFVEECDTMHQLITDYRTSIGVPLDVEFKLLYQCCDKGWGDYHKMTALQRTHVFDHILEHTQGLELRKIMWLRSRSSESWLDNRNTYTRSLAVMSMVGYLLGLGDRHPNNIMIDRRRGKIVHIDFGDCFETAIHRKKFPERVPFRLTRMLVNAMEACKTAGSFKATCEKVLRVLRVNQDSLTAVLRAFVYDPLINWRLRTQEDPSSSVEGGGGGGDDGSDSDLGASGMGSTGSSEGQFGNRTQTPGSARMGTASHHFVGLSPTSIASPGSTFSSDVMDRFTASVGRMSSTAGSGMGTTGGGGGSDHNTPASNDQALAILNRISLKLRGCEFPDVPNGLSIEEQVQRLIADATSSNRLCLHFHGWCAFW